nr:hypothetical protein [Vibrio paracholerae]
MFFLPNEAAMCLAL